MGIFRVTRRSILVPSGASRLSLGGRWPRGAAALAGQGGHGARRAAGGRQPALGPVFPPQARARPLRLHRGEGVGVHGDAERHGGSRHHDARPPHADRYRRRLPPPSSPQRLRGNAHPDFWIPPNICARREPAAARSQERAQVPVAQRSLHPGLLQLRGRRQLGGRHRRAGSAPARGPRGPQGNCFWPGGCGGCGGSRTPRVWGQTDKGGNGTPQALRSTGRWHSPLPLHSGVTDARVTSQPPLALPAELHGGLGGTPFP